MAERKLMNERYVYLLETKLYTFRSYFDAQAPTATSLFTDLLRIHAQNKIGKYGFGRSTASLHKMKIVGNYASFLFRVTNPDILDNRYFSETKDKLRDVKRQGDEEPAISCHAIINLDTKFDKFRAYPTSIENVPYLSRSMVLYMLNNIFADHMKEERLWTPKKGNPTSKPYLPKIKHQAPVSETIGGLLDAKGRLKDIEITEETLQERAAFDNAVTHKVRRSVKIIPETATKPQAMKDFLVSKIKNIDLTEVKKITVSIEDPNHGKPKVISIDPNRTNILDNAFVPQKLLKNISPALTACEDDFHAALTAKMTKIL